MSGANRKVSVFCLLAPLLLAAGARAALPANPPVATPHPARELIRRGWVETRINPEASRQKAEEALRLIEKQPDVDLEIGARLLLCDYLSERDQSAAQAEIVKATALLPHTHRAGLRAGVLTCEGETLETAGHNAQAAILYEQAVTIATDAKDDEMLAGVLFKRGYLQGVQSDYATGLSDLRRSQVLYDKLDMPHHALTALDAIAILYNRMGDYEQAKHIYLQTLKAQRDGGMVREASVTLHNLARAHESLHEWDAARKAFIESLALSKQIDYGRGEAYALRGMAAIANALGDPEEALNILERASALLHQTTDVRLRAQINLVKGMAFHRLHRTQESIDALQAAQEVFRKGNIARELASTYTELGSIYAELGNWRAAYDMQAQAMATNEKLLRNQLNQRFATLKVEFDTNSKEKENTLLLRENQANQKALAQERRARNLQAVVIALTVLLTVLLATLAVFQSRNTRRMRKLAMTDELTGVPNRRAVLRQLAALLKRPDAAPCSILIIDIDHFKSINDHHGHPAGDEVLKVVADKVRASVHPPNSFGRLGGEEFLIVMPGTHIEDARSAADQFREQISSVDTTRWFSDRRRITASIGVTASTGDSDSLSSMLQRADSALYVAKRSGRNCVKSDPAAPETSDWLMDAQPG